MDIRKVKKLIEMLEESADVSEIEIKEGEESVRIRKSEPYSMPMTQHVLAGPAPVASAAAPSAPAPLATNDTATSEPAKAAPPAGHRVTSPMVGTVYLSSAPGDPPFVSVGDKVKAGDVLCLVEAMKMFNQIEADKSGTISARLIENQSPVEYDQPLFIIDTDE